MTMRIVTLTVTSEEDIVSARQRGRQIAELSGFSAQEQTRIATAVSEIARNAWKYARGGKIEFELEGSTPPQILVIRVSDKGPGIQDLQSIREGRYRSDTGMGLGLLAAMRLMDRCDIDSAPGSGTTVTLKKLLPATARLIGKTRLAEIADKLAAMPRRDSLDEIRHQNQELLATLNELRERQDELLRLTRELEDTNRGVVALYAELDEKADHLRRADEMKSRFLSNMSHEFRTPLGSIRALSKLLLDRTDGDLTLEQERQVVFIRKAAEDLSELVNDLLDIAKIEAGKIEVRPVEFEVADLFSALRGMLKPLLVSESVELVFEEPSLIPPLYTDEGKVSQILRNFISNALKFTERGEVRVSAHTTEDGGHVEFAVLDTGIGIAAENQELIFEEFSQVENHLQPRVKGTGLGLPLCRKLAGLLGGSIRLVSQPGQGSTFATLVPIHYAPKRDTAEPVQAPPPALPGRIPVLIVEDDPQMRLLYEKFLKGTRYQAFCAKSVREARVLMEQRQPEAIVLDVLLPGEDAWHWLTEVKAMAEGSRRVPVVVVTQVDDEEKARALGADEFFLKPVLREMLVSALDRLVDSAPQMNALIVDDDEAARYVIKKLLREHGVATAEAGDGASGLKIASAIKPGIIFLDLVMPGLEGAHVLEQLKADPATADIPVVVVTARDLDQPWRERLGNRVHAIVPKSELTGAVMSKIVAEHHAATLPR